MNPRVREGIKSRLDSQDSTRNYYCILSQQVRIDGLARVPLSATTFTNPRRQQTMVEFDVPGLHIFIFPTL